MRNDCPLIMLGGQPLALLNDDGFLLLSRRSRPGAARQSGTDLQIKYEDDMLMAVIKKFLAVTHA